MSYRFTDHSEIVAPHSLAWCRASWNPAFMGWCVDLGPDSGVIVTCPALAVEAMSHGYRVWLEGSDYRPEWIKRRDRLLRRRRDGRSLVWRLILRGWSPERIAALLGGPYHIHPLKLN